MNAEREEAGSSPHHVGRSDFETYQRELALVDEIIGLKAALAQEAVRNAPDRLELEELRTEYHALLRSSTWKLGRIVVLPLRIVRRIARRVG